MIRVGNVYKYHIKDWSECNSVTPWQKTNIKHAAPINKTRVCLLHHTTVQLWYMKCRFVSELIQLVWLNKMERVIFIWAMKSFHCLKIFFTKNHNNPIFIFKDTQVSQFSLRLLYACIIEDFIQGSRKKHSCKGRHWNVAF